MIGRILGDQMLRLIVSAAVICVAAPSLAQEFTPEFYAGVLGGVGPTFTERAKLWEDDGAILSAGAFAGVNLLSGNMLYGVEAGLSSDFGKSHYNEQRYSFQAQPYPRFVGSGYNPGTPVPAYIETSSRPGGSVNNSTLQYSYGEVLARPTVSGRIGVKVQDWTIYGKAGIGAALYRQTNVSDSSASTLCRATATETQYTPSFAGNNYQTYDTGCIDPTPGPIEKTSTSSWSPTIVYGIGAEYDFSNFFARGEVEITQIANGYTNGTTRLNGGLGIKF